MVNPRGGEYRGGIFEEIEENPLEADVIIIDEMSMVDLLSDACVIVCSSTGNPTDPGRRCGSASIRRTGKCSERYYSSLSDFML